MSQLQIKTQKFDIAKNELKEFAKKIPVTTSLKRFGQDDFLWDEKVKGKDMNIFVAQLQDVLINSNKNTTDIVKKFEKIYDTFEYLDKEYIQAIILSVKAAEKANVEALNAQKDIGKTIDGLRITINKLKEFKEETLIEFNSIWDNTQAHKKDIIDLHQHIEVLENHKKKMDSLKHLNDINSIWEDTESIKTNLIQINDSLNQLNSKINSLENTKQESNHSENHKLKSKVSTAYTIAVLAILISIAHFVIKF